ncbi:type II toxin-antitoxin system RelE/ParE family toxin [Plantibacter sp. Mn2098]|uniref:type II toxin-antitoxin system RelE/ParE family toxin n=1 Tax=Plantibacter sp. Mn2098 TaxID=3395266 RepID=UPI003BCA68E3
MHHVRTTRRADEDILDAVAHYVEEGAEDAALRLVDALENAKELLGAHPSLGSPRLAIEIGMPDLRSLTLQRFPYAVLYTESADVVRILRVLHTRRDIPVELAEE